MRNLPVAQIAKQCGTTQDVVRRVWARHFKRDGEWVAATLQLRKWELEQQYGAIDMDLYRVLRLDPTDPAGLKKAGVTVKEWLAAVEASRRVKADLCRLHGLGGPTPLSEADRPPPVTKGDPVDEARIIFRFIESFKGTPLYDQMVAGVAAGFGDAEAADDVLDDLPLPGLNGETPDPAPDAEDADRE